MPHRFTASHDPEHRPQPAAAVFRWAVLDRLTGRRRLQPPGPPAPRVAPDLALVRRDGGPPRLTWTGHAGFLGTLGGRHFLVDPVLSRRIGVAYRAHAAPGLRADELPPLAAVLVSHAHYDHLDLPSLRRLPRDTPAVVPLALGRHLKHFRHVVELDWWQSAEVGGLRVTCVPARHWSRRGLRDLNDTLWGGFVVETGGVAVYHAGDSARFPGFAEIGRRFPGLAAAMLPIGAYAPGWFMETAHMTPEQAGEAFLACGARTLVPMHWGTFQLTDEPIAEPMARLVAWWRREAPAGRRLATPAIGETVLLDGAEADSDGDV